jgi:ABC-type transport system involved in multi-copper enzyme maturation permease subunit
MRPYLTILLDSFRMLKARTIFWVTMGISLLVALLYLSLGFDEKGMSLFFGLVPIENEMFREGTRNADKFYVMLFTKLIAEYWLSWIAVLLGLISCSSIFVEALKEGTAGMELTKKLSRLQVFIAKFLGSLLFVLIPVLLFVVIVFVALRWRVGSWNPTIFWYVPLILLVFTYLYSFLVLIAVKTRSVMTALVLTLILWALSSFIGYVEGQFYTVLKIQEIVGQGQPEVAETGSGSDESETGDAADAGEEEAAALASMERWYDRVVLAYGLFPKTGRTMEVADRLLVVNGEQGIAKGTFTSNMMSLSLEEEDGEMTRDFVRSAELLTERHSTFYAIGTSSLFALVMLILAARVFCRKEI